MSQGQPEPIDETPKSEISKAELSPNETHPPSGVALGNVISNDRSPSFFSIDFRLNADKVTGPGHFVAIEAQTPDGRPALVLARVNDVHEVNPHEDALS